MTEEPGSLENVGPQGSAEVTDSRIGSLVASVRRIKIWLGVLTALLVLAILVSCGALSVLFLGFGGFPFATGMSVSDEQIDAARRDFENGFGSDIESLDVRAVAIEYGDMGFPFAFMQGAGGEETIYVECHLKSSDVVIADLVGYMYGLDAASSGMIPTKGSLSSRMTQEQFDSLLEAFSEETDYPLGSVRRYADRDEMMFESAPIGEALVIGDQEYPANELWAAAEGRLIEGDSVDMSTESNTTRDALIFHEDPATQEFVFLGTEPSMSMW